MRLGNRSLGLCGVLCLFVLQTVMITEASASHAQSPPAARWWKELDSDKYPLYEDFSSHPWEASQFLDYKNQVMEIFEFAFSNYRKSAAGSDELRARSCTGSNELGGFSVSLLEGLSTLAIMDNRESASRSELLKEAMADLIQLVEHPEQFVVRDVDVSVHETIIRVLGPLTSIYELGRGQLALYETPSVQMGELEMILQAAVQLANRLMPAFQSTWDIPYATINLQTLDIAKENAEVSLSAAGTALVEFYHLSVLSRERFMQRSEAASIGLIHKRDEETGLLGTRLVVDSGEWVDERTSVADSYYEYMSKFPRYLRPMAGKSAGRWRRVWVPLYEALHTYSRKGSFWFDVNMRTGKPVDSLFHALKAYWPSILVMEGNLDAAEANFDAMMSLWQRFGGLPEVLDVADVENVLPLDEAYFLRPELAESAFYLYRATGDRKYQYAGVLMLEAIERTMKTECGYTTLQSVVSKEQGDLMPSYFLSETLKYLYLLFDEDHPLLKPYPPGLDTGLNLFRESIVFTTEGQILPILRPRRHDEL